ncbi:ribonuclease H family protein [Brevibacillus sp. NRS-1366]|uniref:ribonuclease H family protein n=1 Tax=Brevibacillus sp. NRS-1366 TaxID=3233899 RepID=UPI003D255FC9
MRKLFADFDGSYLHDHNIGAIGVCLRDNVTNKTIYEYSEITEAKDNIEAEWKAINHLVKKLTDPVLNKNYSVFVIRGDCKDVINGLVRKEVDPEYSMLFTEVMNHLMNLKSYYIKTLPSKSNSLAHSVCRQAVKKYKLSLIPIIDFE